MPRPNERVQYGVVLVFDEGLTKEQVERALEEMLADRRVTRSNVNGFNPEWGGPVWYVP